MTKSLAFLALSLLLTSCVQEGSTPVCGEGGASAAAEEGCATPIGGSCLTESEFKKGRPSERDDGDHTVTIEDDWISYQEARPQCEFDCLTEEEFYEGRSSKRRQDQEKWLSLDDDWDDYMVSRRPDCF